MVCNISATKAELEAVDKHIAKLAGTPARFSGEQPSVLSTDSPMVKQITAEVRAIHEAAKAVLTDLDTMLIRTKQHKEQHMVAWAGSGFPDEGADINGIELGEKTEVAVARRREAVEIIRARKLRQLPVIVDPPNDEQQTASEEELLQRALAEYANRKG